MGIETWIAIGLIAAIVALAAGYVIKSKKSGKKCIGCPGGCSCSCSGACGGENICCWGNLESER